MKFSESWLREWVNPVLETQGLVEQLTMAGLEVDGLDAVAGEFSGVVVGEVVAAIQHPDADKLRVCTVSDGEATHAVVCGAPNAREGIRVAFARVGAKLPGNLKIRKAKLRGVESHGMLCSAKELELGDDHDGIIELPEHCVVGEDVRAALGLNDNCIDIDLTPNRGDCLSIRGVAREVGVLNNQAVTEPEIVPVAAAVDTCFPVVLSDSQGCPRYLGRVIEGIDPTAQTPLWMVEKLRRSGIRSIDPTVDITNYVLLELGQPMHAFDLEVLNGGIDVRRAKAGERLTLLDGRNVELDEQTLLITDGSGPVALAGVMGGERSGITADTKNVFLECAYFAPLALAGTARRYGLHTDASQRYERGVDFELQEAAVERATRLMLDICGGKAGPTVVTEDRDALPVRREVSVAHSRLEQLLGVSIAPSEVDRAFEQLKFPVLSRDSSPQTDDVSWTIQAPSHRFDIEREADLVEEVCRVYGYNNIPARRPTTALTLGHVALEQTSERRLRELLADMGYLETVTYSFVDPGLQDLLDPGAPTMQLENPMSVEQSAMRTTLLPGLLEALKSNVARQAQRLRLFEVGLCFRPGLAASGEKVLEQELTLGGVLWGGREPEGWSGKSENVDFFDAKGNVEQLLEMLGVNTPQTQRIGFAKGVHAVFHPGQYAELVDLTDGHSRRIVGRVGQLHPEVRQRLVGSGAVYAFEIAAQAILAHVTPRYAPVSRYPQVRRDLALVVDQSVAAAEIEAVCRSVLSGKLVDFTFFDVYVGKGIDSNEKSIAIGLTLQAPSATLTDAETGQFVEAVVDALANEVGARLR